MGLKIGGSIGKIANNLKKTTIKDAALGVATGGLSTVYQGVTGKKLGVAGQTGNSPAPIDPNAQIQADAKAKAEADARSDLYRQGVNSTLQPIADQYTALGQQGAITSNVDPAFREYQLGLAQQLQAQANGQGPSIAQAQLQQATDRTLNQSLGAIRSATGANAGLSARTAALANAQGLGTAGNASGLLRLTEQQGAQTALGTLSAQARQGDINTDSNNIQAATQSYQNKLGALNGLSNVSSTMANPYGNIYQTDSGTAAQNDAQDFQAQRDAIQQAEDRKKARNAASAAEKAQIIGAVTTMASAGLGSYAGAAAKGK